MNGSRSKDESSKEIDEKLNKISDFINQQSDELVLVLRAHLLVENYIEKIISANLKRGDFIIGNNLSFFNKLCILKSIDIVPENITTSIERLNAIRNKYSHEMDYKITERDIDLIGFPQSEGYRENRLKFSKMDEKTKIKFLTNRVLYYILGFLQGAIETIGNGTKKN